MMPIALIYLQYSVEKEINAGKGFPFKEINAGKGFPFNP